jgi:uncharacterized protein (DUF1499 family)
VTLCLVACATAAIGLIVLGLAGPAYRIGVLSLQNAFSLLRWAAYIGVTGMIVALAAGALAYARHSRWRLFLAALAFVAALAAFAIPYQLQRSARALPPIHDLSTDLENPPAFEAVVPLRADAANKLDRSPQLADQQRAGYPDLAPMTLPTPMGQTFDRALAVAQKAGWEIVTADKGSGRIEATDTTRWFGFKDDVVVRLTPWGSGTRVDVRSVSRIGRGDIGTNARRIRNYLQMLEG